MALVQAYLQEFGLESLQSTYHIHVGYHSTLPLMVLNYHAIKSPKQDPLIQQCRGLILDLNFNLIATGMNRFFHKAEILNFPVRAEIKEDGTLLHLFSYQNQWVLATRHNFCEDHLAENLTYQGLFESLIGVELTSIQLDPSVTYCLEMCSLSNKIVRLYHQPQIFLLTAFRNGVELSVQEVDLMITQMNWSRPEVTVIQNLTEAKLLIQQYCSVDPTFEGLVLRDNQNNRIKLKSEIYLIIHKLKYRGWIQAKPSVIIPLIVNGQINLILETLSYYKSSWDIQEYQKRVEIYRQRLIEKKKYPGNKDPILNQNHPKKYCRLQNELIFLDTGMAKVAPTTNKVECYCGATMILQRIKTDFLQYKTCHCGVKFDIKIYPVGTLLWICQECNCTHEAHQRDNEWEIPGGKQVVKQGQPTGIPGSEACKNLRLYIHQLMRGLNCNQNARYQILADLLQKDRKDTHVSLFDNETCNMAIRLLQERI